MDWKDLIDCEQRPAKRTLAGALRIYLYKDKIVAEMGETRLSKCEYGQFGLGDIQAIEQETRRKGATNGRPIFLSL